MQQERVPITQGALEEMQRELEHLRTEGRRKVAEEIGQAWESELDPDEDIIPPVMAAKENEGFLEGRIAALEDVIARAEIIDEEAARRSDTVRLGSVVVLVYPDGSEHTYQLVGMAEADPGAGKLSNDSPVGAAIMGLRAGDEVEVQTPSGMTRMRIKELRR